MKRYTILGYGISGAAALRHLLRNEPHSSILVSDTYGANLSLRAELEDLAKQYAPRITLEQSPEHSPQCLESDALIVSPGIPPNSPVLQEAHRLGIPVYTEIDLVCKQVDRLIGITGTNGKSTTTAWIASVLNRPPCGNIGLPLCEAMHQFNMDSGWLACELSSFQLHHSRCIHPHIALITNITPDHLNWHGGWAAYVQAKLKITGQQTAQDFLIVPDDPLFEGIVTDARICRVLSSPVSGYLHRSGSDVLYLQHGRIMLRSADEDLELLSASDIALPGAHNLKNAMFVAATLHYCGLLPNEIRTGMSAFPGLSHRLEPAGEACGKLCYNDSKATNPESTVVALSCFPDKDVIVLLGGRDKGTDLQHLVKACEDHAHTVVVYGEAALRFEEAFRSCGGGLRVQRAESMRDATELALSQPFGDVVLLSPACASFDEFVNFEERGNVFKSIVTEAQRLSD